MNVFFGDSRPQGARPARDAAGASVGNPKAHARSGLRAMAHGAMLRCPACGEGHLYEGRNGGGNKGKSLEVVNYCHSCEEELYHHRADRMAPWFSAFIAANVVLLIAWACSAFCEPPLWAIVPALIAWGLLARLILPSVKGMIVGLQWAHRLYGFQYAAMCKPRHPHPPRKAAPAVSKA